MVIKIIVEIFQTNSIIEYASGDDNKPGESDSQRVNMVDADMTLT